MNLIINVEDDDKLILSDEDAVLAWRGLGKFVCAFMCIFLAKLMLYFYRK